MTFVEAFDDAKAAECTCCLNIAWQNGEETNKCTTARAKLVAHNLFLHTDVTLTCIVFAREEAFYAPPLQGKSCAKNVQAAAAISTSGDGNDCCQFLYYNPSSVFPSIVQRRQEVYAP